jgi:hypothetical protein
MNERIKELITEAWGIPAFKISDIFHWDREEKFAELIILKCAEIADTAEPFLASDLIKQHFGVEE